MYSVPEETLTITRTLPEPVICSAMFPILFSRLSIYSKVEIFSFVFFGYIPGSAVRVLGSPATVKVDHRSVARRFVALGKADDSEHFIAGKISVLVGKIGKIVGQSLKERVVLLGCERVERDDIREEFVRRLKFRLARSVDIGVLSEAVVDIIILEATAGFNGADLLDRVESQVSVESLNARAVLEGINDVEIALNCRIGYVFPVRKRYHRH